MLPSPFDRVSAPDRFPDFRLSALDVYPDRRRLLSWSEEFLGKAGDTLPTPWGTVDVSPAGAPVLDYATNALGGQYKLQLAIDNEAEQIALHWRDSLELVATDKGALEFRFKVASDPTGGGGSLGASGIIVVGVCSAYAADLDTVATNAWVRLGGLTHKVFIETDDGTTDRDDVDSGFVWAEDTWYTIRIDYSATTEVRFSIRADSAAVWTPLNVPGTVMSFAAVNLGMKLQPIAAVQKGAVANLDNLLTIDFAGGDHDRVVITGP